MHTTNLNVPGYRAWLIHNGDFSGESILRWTAEGGDDGVHEARLPSGILEALGDVLPRSRPAILYTLTKVAPLAELRASDVPHGVDPDDLATDLP